MTFANQSPVRLDASGLNIIEVRTDRARNVALHREVWKTVSAALAGEESRARV